jgi:glycosyltransferase involved in cell wall biosynthesis
VKMSRARQGPSQSRSAVVKMWCARQGKPIRAAWMHPVIAHYRVPIINRIVCHPDIELVNFAGFAKEGVSVGDASNDVHAPVHRLHNIRLPGNSARVIYAVGWAKILTGRYEVVITTEATHNLVNWLLLAGKRLFGYRLLVMGHIRPGQENGRISGWLRRRFIRHADGVISYTTEGAAQASAWGLAPESVAVMGNTLDIDRVERAKRELTVEAVASLRERLRVSGLTLLLSGRLTPIKRVDVAIETMRELECKGIDATLIVVGDSVKRGSLESQARGCKRIRFAGAIFDESELAAYFALADFVFIPGAVGLSVIHAFAYGVPLLTAKNVAHRPEIAVACDGVNSVMVDRCEALLFANAITRLVQAPERVQRLKKGAIATELNSADAMADEIAKTIRRFAHY